ncbi:protein rep, partial [Escherichia coli]
RKPKDDESLPCVVAEQLRSAVVETLKYSTKPADMLADPEWFLELTRQVHKRRFVATGGALKNVLQLERET